MKWGLFATIASTVFTATGVWFYFHGDPPRANYWLITTLIVETVYLRMSQ